MTPNEVRELFLNINVETDDIVLTERLENIRLKGLDRALLSRDDQSMRFMYMHTAALINGLMYNIECPVVIGRAGGGIHPKAD